MKWFKFLLIICLIYIGSACSSNNSISANTTSQPKITPQSTIPPTFQINPSATPLKILSIYDVDLPIKNISRFEYVPCYVFSEKSFHAGDIFRLPKNESPFTVNAPIDGIIDTANFVNESVGWEINIKTPYYLNSKQVNVDIVHTSGLASGLHIGSSVEKGQQLAIMDHPYGDPHGGYIIDIAMRLDSHKQANPIYDNWTGTEYFSYFEYIKDNLAQLQKNTYSIMPICSGNPIPIQKRTPKP